MAEKIKGITLEIGGNTTKLNEALKSVDKEANNIKKELKEVEKALKLDPSNTEILTQREQLLTRAIEVQKEKVEALKKAKKQADDDMKNGTEVNQEEYRKVTREIIKANEALKEAKKQAEILGDTTAPKKLSDTIGEINKETKLLKKEINDVDEALKLDPTNTELLKQKQQLLNKELDKQKQKLEALQKAKKQADDDMKSGTEVNQDEYNKLTREIVKTKDAVKDLEKEAKNSNVALSKIGDAGSKMQDIGKKGMVVTGTIVSIGTASLVAASNFEDAMAKVSTIADETEVPIESMKEQILDLSNETGIAATDIADNVYEAISSGQKTGDAVNFVSNATKLAKAGFADSGAALDVLTTIMNAYGLEASKVSDVSDMLIQTQNLGKTTVGELAESMGRVIPTAKSLGVGLDQLSAGYSILTSKGINTHISTTYMNSMLNELGKSSTKVSKVLVEKTGKSFQDLMNEGKSLGDVLEILNGYAEDTGIGFNDLWGSSEAGKAGITLLSDGADSFNDRLKEMNDSVGMTNEAFEKMQTPSQKAQIALTNVKNTGIEIGTTLINSLMPTFEKVTDKLLSLANGFSELSEGQKEVVIGVGLAAAAIPPLITVLGTLFTMISAHPVMSLATALTVAGVALAAYAERNGEASEKTVSFGNVVADMEKKTSALKKELENVTESFSDYQEKLKETADVELVKLDNIETLKDELFSLVDANGYVKDSDKARVDFILNELNGALGTEYEMVGNLISQYGDLKTKINEVLETQRVQAILTAEKGAYEQAIINLPELKSQQVSLLQNVNDSKAAYDEAIKNAEQALAKVEELRSEGVSIYSDEYKNAYEDMVTANDNLAAASKNASDAVNLYDENVKAIEESNQAIAAYENDYALNVEGNTQKILENWELRSSGIALHGEASEAWIKGTFQGIEEQMNDTLESVSEGQLTADSEIVAQAAKTYFAALEQYLLLGKGIPQSVADGVYNKFDTLTSLGITIPSELKTSLDNAEKTADFPQVGESVVTEVESGATSAESSNKLLSIAKYIVDGIEKGLTGDSGKLWALGEKLMDWLFGGSKEKGEIESPSKLFRREIGFMVSKGTALGVLDGKETVVSSIFSVFDDVYATAKSECKTTEYYGNMISQGLANGIKQDMSPEEAMEQKIKNITDIVSDAVKDLDVYSESAKLELEQWKLANPHANEIEINEATRRYNAREVALIDEKITAKEAQLKALETNGASEIEKQQVRNEILEYKNERQSLLNENDEMTVSDNALREENMTLLNSLAGGEEFYSKKMADLIYSPLGLKLQKSGLTDAEIRAWAANESGYNDYRTENKKNYEIVQQFYTNNMSPAQTAQELIATLKREALLI